MTNWNPDQYLKFARERTQASVDLASRIEVENPKSVIDIGCGPGNSTHVLREKWPDARFTGLDSSREMIDKAKAGFPDSEWILGDACSYGFTSQYDVVFSNAAIQWMPDHEELVPKLFSIVRQGGALAVQIPADQDSPIRRSLLSVSSRERWTKYTSGCERMTNYRTAEYYYDIITRLSKRSQLWETIYYHVLDSPSALIEWYKGTAMRPFLESLPDDGSRNEFENDVLAGCRDEYEVRRDGHVLYPFRRIFFLVYR